ncbi:PEP-CTERM sorting domain-containing protein [Cylindrospermum stagnale]|nr:PEP-CTERM sorting domain-containing protein [Cylindrospermum stagnale]
MAAAPAQAGTLYGSLGLSGNATVSGTTSDPIFTFSPGAISPGDFTGQFAGATAVVGPTPFTLKRVGATNQYNLVNDVVDFLKITLSDSTTVKVNLLKASPAFSRLPNNPLSTNFQFQIIDFLDADFIEPDNTVTKGTLALNLSKSGQSTTFQLTADKPKVDIPEPSALLGLGGLGAFAFSTGLKRKRLVQA